VRNRLKTYHEHTAPLIHYYEDLHLLQTLECHHSKEKVTEKLFKILHIN
jgi:adenylate kinase family enzyme